MGQRSSQQINAISKVSSVVTPQTRSRLLQKFNERRKILEELPNTLSPTIQPNGLFPVEIIEMLLVELSNPYEQFQLVSCCKLWLRVILSKRFDWYNRRFGSLNIKNGLYWPSMLLKHYRPSGGSVLSSEWLIHNNCLVIYNLHFLSIDGTITNTQRTYRMDLTNKSEVQEIEFGTNYVNEFIIRPLYNTEQGLTIQRPIINCIRKDGSSFQMRLEENGYGNKQLTAIPNLDGSNRVLLFFSQEFRSDRSVIEYEIRTFNLETGKQLNKINLETTMILGYWQYYVIAYGNDSITFHDLGLGGYKIFKHKIPLNCLAYGHQPLFIRDNKMIIAGSDNWICYYDLNDTNYPLLQKFDMKERIGIVLGTNDKLEISSVAFDDWKLVLVLCLYQREFDPNVGTAIFDMTKDFAHLNTIGTGLFCSRGSPVKILLPPENKIFLNSRFSGVLEIDFTHPNLFQNTIKVGRFKVDNKLVVESVPTISFIEYITKLFDTTLNIIAHTTFYPQVPTHPKKYYHNLIYAANEICANNDGIFELDPNPTKRITFIFPLTLHRGSLDEPIKTKFSWMKREDFDLHWKIRPEHFSTLHLTSLDLTIPQNIDRFRSLENMHNDDFVILFEEFDPQTNQWLITEPYVPAGTSLVLS